MKNFLSVISEKTEKMGFTFDLELVHLDFETAAINAVWSTFGPHVNTEGCFYHLTQSIWRKVEELGLSYKEDTELKYFCIRLDVYRAELLYS